jgi:hypothetical protein
MALKCKFGISRDGFNEMLVVISTLLPKEHSLPQSSYEAQKLLRVLTMPYDAIDACTNGCVLFRKEHADAKYCPKCKSSRYLELDSGGGHKRKLDVPVKILRYLPFIPRITRMYMTEETAKQMTWHKTGKWYYGEDIMLHPADAESWQYSTVVILTRLRKLEMYVWRWLQMGSILMDWWPLHTLVGPCLLPPSILSPASCLSGSSYLCPW